jgi:ABC-type multidrug transport system ATPase subunit
MPDYAIETRNLMKKIDHHMIVNDLNLHVSKGKIYGLLGRNGAGKTTTMKMLLRLVRPTEGEILLLGERDTKNVSRIYEKIGALIETPGFYENLTGYENLQLIAKLRGNIGMERIGQVLKQVGIDQQRMKRFGKYSLGMKQRLGIAAAILHEPEILVLDEPINGLDPVGIHEMRDYLVRLCKEKGTTIFLSSHVLSEIEQMADIIGVIHEGRLLEETDMEELRKRNRRYIEVEVSDPWKAADLLENQFQTKDFEVGQNRLRIFGRVDQSAEINQCFTLHGLAVSRVDVAEVSLEDYFSTLVEGGDKENG